MIKSQSGRSMVEMLGVLAVVGILSITGVAGYKTAIGRYQINQLTQGVTVAVMELFTSGSLENQKNANINEISEELKEVATIELGKFRKNENAYIGVSFSDDDLCKQFKNSFVSTGEYEVIGCCGRECVSW